MASFITSESIPDEPNVPEGAWLCPPNGPYPAGAPLVINTPEEGSPWVYDEDEFVALWSQIYRIFLRLGHIKSEEVIFPPEDTGRHGDLDAGLLGDRFHMSDRAVSLLERLPYLITGAGRFNKVEFFPEGEAFNYVRPEDKVLQTCRDPHPQNRQSLGRKTPSQDYLYPDDVALLSPSESDGKVWILDTKTNAIRTLWDICQYEDRVVPDDFVDERPQDKNHYRNWPAFHAPFILKRYIRDLWSLKFVPSGGGDEVKDSDANIEGLLVARSLRRQYGWPDHFREEAWKRESRAVESAAFELADELRQGRFGMDDELIRQWKESGEEIPALDIPAA